MLSWDILFHLNVEANVLVVFMAASKIFRKTYLGNISKIRVTTLRYFTEVLLTVQAPGRFYN